MIVIDYCEEPKMDIQGLEPWTLRSQLNPFWSRCKAYALPLCQMPDDDEDVYNIMIRISEKEGNGQRP